MKYLIFTNTPAHVHLYKNVVERLQSKGHEVLVLGRDYGCTEELLSYYEMPYEIYGGQSTSVTSLIANVPRQFATIFRRVREYEPDVIFGRGSYAAFAETISRAQTVLVIDSTPLNIGPMVSSRFAHRVLTPESYGRSLGDHHDRFDGLKECAYLHPEVFSADPPSETELDVAADEPYVIVRFNAYDSIHDVGLGGDAETDRLTLLERLSEHATVFVSDESDLLDLSDVDAKPLDIHPARIHHVLAGANLVITDTGTIATEASLLGTPAIRFIDEDEPEMGEFTELEANDLLVQHTDLDAVISEAVSVLDDPGVQEEWEKQRDAYLSERPNLTRVLLDVAEEAGAA